MPHLPFYADQADIERVMAFLNDDSEVAFVIPNGSHEWKAVERLTSVTDGRYCIWYHSGGGLPLMRPGGLEPLTIDNPWAGWADRWQG